MRYYSTQRPVGPGTYPKPDPNDPKWAGISVSEIHNFDRREIVLEIGRTAWGWVEYTGKIPEKDVRDYELVPEANKMTGI